MSHELPHDVLLAIKGRDVKGCHAELAAQVPERDVLLDKLRDDGGVPVPGGQVDRRPERKVASWVRVSAPAASTQSSTVFGPQPRPQALPVRPCLLASWSPPSSQPDRHQIHLLGTGKQV